MDLQVCVPGTEMLLLVRQSALQHPLWTFRGIANQAAAATPVDLTMMR
jgi:hypothetical protein